jgi:hypothetical protein
MTLQKSKIWIYILIIIVLCSFTHKFYVSITQIDYKLEKNQIQIATRFFIDDVEKALQNKYKEKIYIDAKTTSDFKKQQLENYIKNSYIVDINGKNQTLNYLGFEIENEILIVYLTINNIKKIKTIDIKINALFEVLNSQQHIVHTHILDKKCSLLLTEDNKSQQCKY